METLNLPVEHNKTSHKQKIVARKKKTKKKAGFSKDNNKQKVKPQAYYGLSVS